jgi:YD repeat-containing protein
MATAYDALGRRVAETNEAGVVTALGYDALGRLTTVTNALGLPEQSGVAYTYDEAGNLTTEHRPDNRNTRFEFDGLGRRTRRILPVNIPTLSESFSYDAAGNLLRHTHFNGQVITNAYDVMNRCRAGSCAAGTRWWPQGPVRNRRSDW